MTNLSKSLRSRLQKHFRLSLPKIIQKTTSSDGSVKYLFETEKGDWVESIWMPEEERKTLCISSQVGCRLACSFCLTGALGLKGQLTAGDIIGQYLAVNRDLPAADRITNIVFMGMGEPLDNFQPVVEAIRLLVSPTAVRFPTRKVTLSTAGLVDRIRQFGQESLPVNLAVSLNASDNRTRDRIMPINRKYPIEMLLDCLEEYQIRPNRRITIEYVLLQGINDSPEDAMRLARLLRRIPCKVNLIPFNGFTGSPYCAPTADQVSAFQELLVARHYSVFVRKNRGMDILGACGQLAAESFQ